MSNYNSDQLIEKQFEIVILRQQVTLLRDALTESRRELDSCQKVIWLASDYGFDPAYVKGAQASIRKTDEALAATEPKP